MNILTLILSAVTILNIAMVITLIFFERKDPTATWAWVLILVLLPVVGFILYLFIGLTPRKRKIFDRKTEADIDIKKQQIMKPPSPDMNRSLSPKQQKICQMNFGQNDIVYTENNQVEIYTQGLDKFRSLFQELERAEEHIHVCYYIIRGDQLGKTLIRKLTEKASQGVEVRLLYDSVGCRKLPRNFFTQLENAGGQVSNFFFSILDINYRNHRKIVVIDGKVSFVGGANVGKEYLGLSQKFEFWRDTHLKIHGDASKSLQTRFLLDWYFATDENLTTNKRYLPKLAHFGNSGMQIVTSGPDSSHEEIKSFFLKMIYAATESIYLQTPYFIPDESILEALQIAAYSGIDIRIVIPDRPDHPFVFWANRAYLGIMLESGARGFIYKKGFMHSKLMIVDGEIATVGTANMDVRSFKLNFEINSLIYDQDIAKKLQGAFLIDLNHSEEMTEDQYNQRGVSAKFKESISRLLSPIL